MPHSDDRTLISCAGDSDVRVFDIEYTGRSSIPSTLASSRRSFNTVYQGVRYLGESDTNARVYRCHADRVKRIVTESSPHLFLTCSEDGEVRQWDLRQPSSAYPEPQGGRRTMAWRGARGMDDDSGDGNVPPPLITYSRYQLDLNTISCSATQPHYIALGGAHLHCFLHDRRMLGRDVTRERGSPSTKVGQSQREEDMMDQATRCVRRFAPNGSKRMRRRDNGHITACKISDHNPNEMIVSWTGDWIYSFNLVRSPGPEPTEDGGSEASSRGGPEGRARESRDRKRKREKTSSNSSTRERRGGSRPRQSDPDVDAEADLVLRVRYQNGQSEEIPIEEGTSQSEAPIKSIPRARETLLPDRLKTALVIATSIRHIQKELFDLESRRWPHAAATTSREVLPDSRPFTTALGYAAAYLPIIDEVSRTWRYPLNPTRDEVRFQQAMRRNRESVYRFVQAAGTTCRLLGGKLRTTGPGESPALEFFKFVMPAPNESHSLDTAAQFKYDFIRAILAWLDSGPDGLLGAFKRTSAYRSDHPRFPIRENQGLEAIDGVLIPYLLGLAGSSSVWSVEVTRFERDEPRTVFESERAAVIAFSNAIKIPFEDLSQREPSDEAGGGAGSSRNIQDRDTAKRFWALLVVPGLLRAAAEDITRTSIIHAFGGIQEMSEEEVRGLEEVEDIFEEEAEEEWPELRTLQHPVMPAQADIQSMTRHSETMTDGHHNEQGSSQQQTGYSTVEDGGVEEHMSLLEEGHEEPTNGHQSMNVDEEREEEEEDEEEDQSDMEVEEEDDGAEESQFILTSAFDRSQVREQVAANVPCSSHTRVYRGHCNVETVKDVNFYGLQDEYVVSGSDAGHVFIWDKKTTQIVNILEGDEDVVNVIQGQSPYPFLFVSFPSSLFHIITFSYVGSLIFYISYSFNLFPYFLSYSRTC